MKSATLVTLSLLLFNPFSKAQQIAMDFTMDDCNGEMHNCFSTLDSGYVIIMEFFMTCNSCVKAGHEVETMKAGLDAQYPGKIKFYQLAFTNSYSCNTVLQWVNDNGFNSVPFDSGAALVAYYGGFGMPTFAVIAGPGHDVLFTGVGYSSSDTTDMASAINNYFSTTGVNSLSDSEYDVDVFPNPSSHQLTIQLDLKQSTDVTIELLSLSGEHLATISDEKMNAGIMRRSFAISPYPPGVYLIRTSLNGEKTIKQITIAR